MEQKEFTLTKEVACDGGAGDGLPIYPPCHVVVVTPIVDMVEGGIRGTNSSTWMMTSTSSNCPMVR